MKDIIFSSLLLAGVGMLWRRLLTDHQNWKLYLRSSFPKVVFEAIECPFCLSFWLSLLFVIFFDPLRGWMPEERIVLPFFLLNLLQIIFSWMVLGVLVVTARVFTEQLFKMSMYLGCILKNHPIHGHKKE